MHRTFAFHPRRLSKLKVDPPYPADTATERAFVHYRSSFAAPAQQRFVSSAKQWAAMPSCNRICKSARTFAKLSRRKSELRSSNRTSKSNPSLNSSMASESGDGRVQGPTKPHSTSRRSNRPASYWRLGHRVLGCIADDGRSGILGFAVEHRFVTLRTGWVVEATAWHAEQAAEKAKQSIRRRKDEVIADIDAEKSEIVRLIHWQDGIHTKLRVPDGVAGVVKRLIDQCLASLYALSSFSGPPCFTRRFIRTGRPSTPFAV